MRGPRGLGASEAVSQRNELLAPGDAKKEAPLGFKNRRLVHDVLAPLPCPAQSTSRDPPLTARHPFPQSALAGVHFRTSSQRHSVKGQWQRGGMGRGAAAGRSPSSTPFPALCPQPGTPSLLPLPGSLVYLSRPPSHATSPEHLPVSRHSWNPNSVPWATRRGDLCHDVPHWPSHSRMVIFEPLVLTRGLTLGEGREEPVQE